MDRVPIDETQVFVVPDPERARNNNFKGSLFEAFIARLMAQLGYEHPTTSNLNVTSGGIELDVSMHQRLHATAALAECKAYSAPVPAHMLDAFFGKLTRARYKDANLLGVFVALPRLTANGEEQAREIEAEDKGFRYLNAVSIYKLVATQGLIVQPPLNAGLLSDFAILITEHGVFQAARQLDPNLRTAMGVLVWASAPVPDAVLTAVRHSPLADGLSVNRAGSAPISAAGQEPIIAKVAASSSDFEYQLPAAPKFFVGRQENVDNLRDLLTSDHPEVIVLNAQSGWGKSSLALRVGHEVSRLGGRALVLDSRTASSPAYVPAALHALATEGASARILRLPESPAFGTTTSSLRTFGDSDWTEPRRPLMIFFDQFENVFRDFELTRSFRDLALAVRDLDRPLKIGFAWKTDLVGWTEGHPYQLRDEIRSAGTVLSLRPLGPSDISTLLSRLQRDANQKLGRDLRDRLREYSGGLPWLFKKLAGHILDELTAGRTEHALLAEALNVQGLFESDLAQLQPEEQAALRSLARSAPVLAADVLEVTDVSIVQSLLDRRLIVQVGERLDTYWDIFRDYLNTGTVPIKDAYILRLNPSSAIGKLLESALDAGGTISVRAVADLQNTSEAVVFNLARDLRLLGLVTYDSGRISILPAVLESDDREAALRKLTNVALRRHRAYEVVFRLLEESDETVPIASFAQQLAHAFPAVSVSHPTWDQYARAFAYWLAYAGLCGLTGTGISAHPDATSPDLSLLGRVGRVSVKGTFPHSTAQPALDFGVKIAQGTSGGKLEMRHRKALRALETLGLASSPPLSVDTSVFHIDGTIDVGALRAALEARVAGTTEALQLLEGSPGASAADVGTLLRDFQGASWTPTTTSSVGKNFRTWAKAVGVATTNPRKGPEPGLQLFS
jgi:hypothetical protein